jgi:hypothetical protein
LRTSAIEEGLLKDMQAIFGGETLNGDDFRAFRLENGNKAAVYQEAIHQNRTRTALSFSAALLDSRQIKLIP